MGRSFVENPACAITFNCSNCGDASKTEIAQHNDITHTKPSYVFKILPGGVGPDIQCFSFTKTQNLHRKLAEKISISNPNFDAGENLSDMVNATKVHCSKCDKHLGWQVDKAPVERCEYDDLYFLDTEKIKKFKPEWVKNKSSSRKNPNDHDQDSDSQRSSGSGRDI